VSEALRRRGIPTPRVVAAAVYPEGIWYRADLVTEFLEGSTDLGEFLFQATAPGDPREARMAVLEEAGRLVGRMGALAIRHPDLNAKNLLVQATPDDGPRIHLLDLDRCRARSRAPLAAGWRMRRRLVSSLRKWERKGGRPLLREEWAALERGFQDGG
jgi:3-deoxy-D-manno-octulosonic acid kinase